MSCDGTTQIVSLNVPSTDNTFGTAVDVSTLNGKLTVVLSGVYTGRFVIYGSHNGVNFTPLLTFDSGTGVQQAKQTLEVVVKYLKVFRRASNTSNTSIQVAAQTACSTNNFISLPAVLVGSKGPQASSDLWGLIPPTGASPPISVFIYGKFSGTIAIEGSLDNINFSPVGSSSDQSFAGGFSISSQGTQTQEIVLPPLIVTDAVRYIRTKVTDNTYVYETLTVTLGASQNQECSGSGGIRSFDNVADMISAGSSGTYDNEAAILLGYYQANDKGGGDVYWDATSTTTANSGNVFQVSGVAVGRWKRLDEAAYPLNVLQWGAKGDGVFDNRSFVQNAINNSGTNVSLLFPSNGKYLIAGASLSLPVGTIRFYATSDQSDQFVESSTYIYAKDITGPLIDRSLCNATLRGTTVKGIAIDGGNETSNFSTTWTGLVDAAPAGQSFFYLNVLNSRIRGSAVLGARAVDCTNLVFGKIENSLIQNFVNGYGFYGVGDAAVLTTLSIKKCYLQQNLECSYFGGNVFDITYDDAVFESSLVAVAGYDHQAKFSGCYFENIGVIPTGSSQTHSITRQNMGIANGSTAFLDTAIHFRYGMYDFVDCWFAYLNVGGTAIAWTREVGLASANGSNGTVKFTNCECNPSDRFIATETAAGDRGGFVIRIEDPVIDGGGRGPCINKYADARLTTSGRIVMNFSAGVLKRPVLVENSLFTYGLFPDTTVYAGGLTDSPTGGQNVIGDKVITTTPTSGGFIGYVATASGTPGTWKGYGAIA